MSYTNEKGITYQIKPIKRIPWWMVYPVLLIIGSVLLFIIYRGYIKSDSQEIYEVGYELSASIIQNNQHEENLDTSIVNTYEDVSILVENNLENDNSISKTQNEITVSNN